MIYYAGSKARVEVPFDETLRARTLEAIALVRGPRCPRDASGAASAASSVTAVSAARWRRSVIPKRRST